MKNTENEKVALSIREVTGNPFDEIREKVKGDIVTCSVIETGEYGVKVRNFFLKSVQYPLLQVLQNAQEQDDIYYLHLVWILSQYYN